MLAYLLVGFVAAVQLAISIVEMFFWKHAAVHERLGFVAAEANKVAPIVANAGLYNGFIAAGLIRALFTLEGGRQAASFFLICVVIAGIFGAFTLKPTTLVLQTLPGAFALLAVWMVWPISK